MVRQEPAKLLSPVQIRVSPISKARVKGSQTERAISAVGSALERHSRGHKFEPCIAQIEKGAERLLFLFGGISWRESWKTSCRPILYVKRTQQATRLRLFNSY